VETAWRTGAPRKPLLMAQTVVGLVDHLRRGLNMNHVCADPHVRPQNIGEAVEVGTHRSTPAGSTSPPNPPPEDPHPPSFPEDALPLRS
jgi:hypothetical protein